MGMRRFAGHNKKRPVPIQVRGAGLSRHRLIEALSYRGAGLKSSYFFASNQASARARAFSRIFRKKNE